MFDNKTNTFILNGKNISYCIREGPLGHMVNTYFGKRLYDFDHLSETVLKSCGHSVWIIDKDGRKCDLNQLPLEVACYGLGDFHDPSFYALLKNGSRITDFTFKSFKLINNDEEEGLLPQCTGGETLKITLEDSIAQLKLYLFYTVFEERNVIIRRILIENVGQEVVKLKKVSSFCLSLKNETYDEIYLYGAHLNERNIERRKITRGLHVIDSKRGVSSAQLNPFLAVCSKNCNENCGDVYGFNIIYSGNFYFGVELDEFENIRINGGINPFDFEWTLQTGEVFETPQAVLVYSECGFNGMSQEFHDLYREHLINKNFAKKSRPIVVNNWEATYFDFDEKKIKEIIDVAYDCDIDTFVLDDGWFGCRNDDTSSLGDWFVNSEKFPHGLKAISDYCHEKGMKFGLWFEPEMVNQHSKLNALNPEWTICDRGRITCEGRNQYVLDLTNKNVREYIYNVISDHIDNLKLDYIKWDMNRSITENCSLSLSAERSMEFSHRYVLGLYEILKTITEKYPDVLIEGCASGGCRFDPAILKYCPQIWTSDNTDAYCRAFIQYGTSLCYPLSSMSCHVSACPNHQTGRSIPFSTRNDIASLGVFGYELDITKTTHEERSIIKNKIKEYRINEDLVLFGDLYRLCSPFESDFFIEEIVSKKGERAVITFMKFPCSKFEEIKVYPKGLDEKGFYSINNKGLYNGRELMTTGFTLKCGEVDFLTQKFTLIKEK